MRKFAPLIVGDPMVGLDHGRADERFSLSVEDDLARLAVDVLIEKLKHIVLPQTDRKVTRLCPSSEVRPTG